MVPLTHERHTRGDFHLEWTTRHCLSPSQPIESEYANGKVSTSFIVIQVHWHLGPPRCSEILINSLSIRICSFTIMDCAYYWSMLQSSTVDLHFAQPQTRSVIVRGILARQAEREGPKLTNMFNTFASPPHRVSSSIRGRDKRRGIPSCAEP